MHSKLITIIFTFILFFSCSSNNEKYEEFFDIYEDIYIARVTILDSALAQNAIDSILKSRELSQDDFKNLMIEMSEENNEFVPRLKKLREDIDSMKDSLININK